MTKSSPAAQCNEYSFAWQFADTLYLGTWLRRIFNSCQFTFKFTVRLSQLGIPTPKQDPDILPLSPSPSQNSQVSVKCRYFIGLFEMKCLRGSHEFSSLPLCLFRGFDPVQVTFDNLQTRRNRLKNLKERCRNLSKYRGTCRRKVKWYRQMEKFPSATSAHKRNKRKGSH